MDPTVLRGKSFFIFCDSYFSLIAEYLHRDSGMEYANYPESADVVLVMFQSDQEQWQKLQDLCRAAPRDQVIITKPVLGFDLLVSKHPNLCCFSYKAYDSCFLRFLNESRMRGNAMHVNMTEDCGYGQFNEFFQMLAMFHTLVTPEVFNRLTVRINKKQTSGSMFFFGRDENDPTASLYMSLSNGPGYRSSQEAFGKCGRLSRMENHDGVTYMETWGAAMVYTLRALSCGNRGVIDRNRKAAVEIVSKLKTVRGAANMLIGR